MEMTGTRLIPATRQTVWEALNDPEILKRCIPGCRSLVPNAAGNGFDAEAGVKIGPVNAGFSGGITLEDVKAPESYRIVGEGKGVAGFARGTASIGLKDANDGGTLLDYRVTAQVGGKLAQIGARLLDSAAKKYANDFFATFENVLNETGKTGAGGPPEEDKGAAPPAAAPKTETTAASKSGGGGLKSLSSGSWILLTIMAVLVLLWIFSG